MKSFCIITLILLFLPAQLSAQTEEKRIVMISHKIEGYSNAFWETLRQGGADAAEAAGYKFEYVMVPEEYKDTIPMGQDMLVRKAVDTGAAGILLTPVDRFRLVQAVNYAVIREVPVVSVDSAVKSSLVSGIVATNGYEGGLAAAVLMTELLGSDAAVVMLGHPARGNRATLDRERSFLAGLERFAPDIRVLSSDRYGTAEIDGDYRAALSLIRDFPELQGAYAVSGSGGAGFLKALQETGRAGKVVLIVWDAEPATIKGLLQGEVHGILQQDPEKMAKTGVELLIQSIAGSEQRRNISISPVLLRREALYSAEARRLLAPVSDY